MSAARDRGSATLELAVLAPVLLALLGLVIVAGRLQVAAGVVEQSAAAAARAASLSRDARAARAVAEQVARRSLSEQSIACEPLSTQVELAGFAVPVGQPATVTVEVSCRIALADVVVPGVPGARTVVASMVSPLDRFRARG